MTRIRVGPEALTALAGAVSGVADELAWFPGRVADDTWAFGPGDTPAALGEVLGDFEHQRLLLGRSCAALAAAVRSAGAAYAEVEGVVAAAAGGAVGGGAPAGGAPGGTGTGTGAGTGTGTGGGAEAGPGGGPAAGAGSDGRPRADLGAVTGTAVGGGADGAPGGSGGGW